MENKFHYHLVDITKYTYLPEDFNIVICFQRSDFRNPSKQTLVLKRSAEENLALSLFFYTSVAPVLSYRSLEMPVVHNC